jgi:hypothetical protein
MFITNSDNWELTKRTAHNIPNQKGKLGVLTNKEKFFLEVDADAAVSDITQNAPNPFLPIFFFEFVEPIIPRNSNLLKVFFNQSSKEFLHLK